MTKLREEHVDGYENFQNKLQQIKGDGFTKIWALFCGTLKEPGKSWCPDCTRALPVIDSGLTRLKDKLLDSSVKAAYLFVSIERDHWRTSHCPFRVDEKLKLTSIPTVIYWEDNAEKHRLTEGECSVSEKVNAVFDV